MLEVKNVGSCVLHPEIVKISPKPGEQNTPDYMTVMPGGRVRVPNGYRLAVRSLTLPGIVVIGTPTPELPT